MRALHSQKGESEVYLIDQRLEIDVERFKADFDALSQIGATTNGGIHRPALSPNHLKARAWFRERVEDAGLVFEVDQAGNHSAILPCQKNTNTTLLIGSHLDSVPYGGRFDGALGVLAALETLRVIKERNIDSTRKMSFEKFSLTTYIYHYFIRNVNCFLNSNYIYLIHNIEE